MSKTKINGTDNSVTVGELKALIEEFVLKRDWAKFHSPKNLSMALGVEAGELMDLFRWRPEENSVQIMKTGKVRKAAAEELADVIICALSFANRTGIDVASSVRRKVDKNAKKYPAGKFRGKF